MSDRCYQLEIHVNRFLMKAIIAIHLLPCIELTLNEMMFLLAKFIDSTNYEL